MMMIANHFKEMNTPIRTNTIYFNKQKWWEFGRYIRDIVKLPANDFKIVFFSLGVPTFVSFRCQWFFLAHKYGIIFLKYVKQIFAIHLFYLKLKYEKNLFKIDVLNSTKHINCQKHLHNNRLEKIRSIFKSN